MRYALCISAILLAATAFAADPIPLLQALPEPYYQLSFQRDAQEIARFHFSPDLRRPFVFPLVGPSDRSLTRMGHPHDPETHSHHNSVWISHNDVNGLSFWDDRSKGRIVHQRIEEIEDHGDVSWITTLNAWLDESANKTLLTERRRTTVQLLPDNEFLLILDLRLEAQSPVTLGKTPFGLLGVRMAKTIGVNDGGGVIRNSAGQVNEKEVLWKPAKWCDYSGPITPAASEGITLFDHPSNPNHPTIFHVRADGWMGASLTYNSPLTISPDKPLTLRYALWIHAGKPSLDQINHHWSSFAQSPPADLTPKKNDSRRVRFTPFCMKPRWPMPKCMGGADILVCLGSMSGGHSCPPECSRSAGPLPACADSREASCKIVFSARQKHLVSMGNTMSHDIPSTPSAPAAPAAPTTSTPAPLSSPNPSPPTPPDFPSPPPRRGHLP